MFSSTIKSKELRKTLPSPSNLKWKSISKYFCCKFTLLTVILQAFPSQFWLPGMRVVSNPGYCLRSCHSFLPLSRSQGPWKTWVCLLSLKIRELYLTLWYHVRPKKTLSSPWTGRVCVSEAKQWRFHLGELFHASLPVLICLHVLPSHTAVCPACAPKQCFLSAKKLEGKRCLLKPSGSPGKHSPVPCCFPIALL